jgi:hypothetical protein
MGTTNNIKETNISLKLEGLECSQCNQKFTQQEIDAKNYDLKFDITNDVNLEAHKYPSYGYQLII